MLDYNYICIYFRLRSYLGKNEIFLRKEGYTFSKTIILIF